MKDPKRPFQRRGIPRRAWLTGASLALLGTGACVRRAGGAALRDFATRIRPAPKGLSLAPPAPSGVYWLKVATARISARTPEGALWDDVGGWPDPRVVVEMDGRAILTAEGPENTLQPTFDDAAAAGNFALDREAKMTVVVYDADPLRDRQIGRADFNAPTAVDASTGSIELDVGKVGNPGRVTLAVEPAHALLGLGFDYELYERKAVVSRVLRHGPADRAGVVVGDVLLGARGVLFRDLQPKAIKSAINSITADPVDVIVEHESGRTESFAMAEGPIYALYDEWGPVP
ncbi:MAG: hypothetical protein AAGA56_25700 [Myxococcota bacterium]